MAFRREHVEVQMLPLATLKPYDGNAKKHTNEQVDAVEASIKEFGFRNPVIAWHNDSGEPEIVAGHARCIAAKNIGMEEVPVIFVDDLSDAQRRALTLVDNQTTMMTGWDMDQLGYELDVLSEEFDMSDFGFDEISTVDDDMPGQAGAMGRVESLDIKRDYLVLVFDDDMDFLQACQLFGAIEGRVPRTKNVADVGLGRVIDGVQAIQTVKGLA